MPSQPIKQLRAEKTHQALLQAAFEEIWLSGFRGASLDVILKRAGVTKGALYHHFSDKYQLGYEVIDDYIRWLIYDDFLRPLEETDDPIEALEEIIRAKSKSVTARTNNSKISVLSKNTIRLGCPLNNLAQEMSPLDNTFQEKLNQVYQMWREGLSKALRHAQMDGTIRQDIDPLKASTLIIGAIQGAISMAKTAQNAEPFRACCDGLMDYIRYLRTPQRTDHI